MEEQIQNIIENGQQIVVEQEPVHGGYRPLVRLYILDEDIVTERISYSTPATASHWESGRYSNFILNEGEYKTIEI
jgi:hypothetical protein